MPRSGSLLPILQAALGGMGLALGLAQPADPPATRIVVPMPPLRVMDLVNQPQGEPHVLFLTGHPR